MLVALMVRVRYMSLLLLNLIASHIITISCRRVQLVFFKPQAILVCKEIVGYVHSKYRNLVDVIVFECPIRLIASDPSLADTSAPGQLV